MKLVNTLRMNQNGDLRSDIPELQKNMDNLFRCLNGRVRFGRGTDGDRGENIQGEFQQFTTSATPDAENTIAHGIGAIPVGYIILWQDKAGSLYQGPSTGTAWTSSNIYLKCTVASVTFKVFLIQ
jgi:hypothetical protein